MPDTIINAPDQLGTSDDTYAVTGLPGGLLYVRTPPEGSLINFGEFARAKAEGNTGVVEDLVTEYAKEVALIGALACSHFGQESDVRAVEEMSETGELELILVVGFPYELADLEVWSAFHRDVLKAIPRGRMTSIVLRPAPRDADEAA